MNLRSRDYDNDATPNYMDFDSDNDMTNDNFNSNPYGSFPKTVMTMMVLVALGMAQIRFRMAYTTEVNICRFAGTGG